jgi:hypothetical protein
MSDRATCCGQPATGRQIDRHSDHCCCWLPVVPTSPYYLVGALVARQVPPAAACVEEPLALIMVVLIATTQHHTLVAGEQEQDRSRTGAGRGRHGPHVSHAHAGAQRASAHERQRLLPGHQQQLHACTGQHNTQTHLCPACALPCNACHVWEVSTPLAAVQPVLPPVTHLHTLQGGGTTQHRMGCQVWLTPRTTKTATRAPCR